MPPHPVRRPTPLFALLLAAVAASASGCASGPPPVGPGPRAWLFVSPAGEPFRARPGEPYPLAAWFSGADADRDGRLTLEEFRADADRFARILDKDGNGDIDGFELADYEHGLPEMTPELRGLNPGEGQARLGEGPDGRGGGRRAGGGDRPRRGVTPGGVQGAAAFSLLGEAQPVAGSDRNLDGRVDMGEVRWAADQRFRLLDKDMDGALTLAELPQTRVQAAAARAAGRERRNPGTAPLNGG